MTSPAYSRRTTLSLLGAASLVPLLPGRAMADTPRPGAPGPAPEVSEWEALRTRLDGIQGVATAPPASVVTKGFTTGALLGNGDLGVVVGDSAADAQSFRLARMEHIGRTWIDYADQIRDSVLPIAQLRISSPRPSPAPASVYRMTQDIRTAEVRSAVQLGGQTVSLTSWLSESGNTLVTEASTPDGTADTTLTLDLTATPSAPGHGLTYPTAASVAADGSALCLTREGNGGGTVDWRSTQAVAVRLLGASFSAASAGEESATATFTLKGGTPVTIVTEVRGDARPGPGGPSAGALAGQAADAARALDADRIGALWDEHHAWWKEYWLRSHVSLGGDAALERYYYGALYVLGACVRAGKLSPGLWGPWVTSDTNSWGDMYFLNYNFESPFYGAGSTNRPELLRAYSRTVLDELPHQRTRTAALGYRGVCFSRTFMGQHTGQPAPAPVPVAPQKNPEALVDQKSNGSFAFIPAIWRWEYYREIPYLRDELYPALKELAAFWDDYMTWDPATSRYVVEHSGSHEGWDDFNAGLDLGYIRTVHRTLIETSRVLGADRAERTRWQRVLDTVSELPTDTYAGTSVYTLAETIAPAHSAFVVGDQPINLEGVVHPAENVQRGSAEEDVRRAKDTLRLMNSWGHTTNGYAKTFVMAARTGWNGTDLLAKFGIQTAKRWRASNLTYEQGGGGIETVANIEMVNSMLLGGESETLSLFPGWPAERDASFTRLRTKGGHVVSASLSGGQVRTVTLVAGSAGPLRLVSPWPGAAPDVRMLMGHGRPGPARRVTRGTDGAYVFTAAAGQTYVIARAGGPADGGALTGAVTTATPGDVDLTARGGLDWVHWGRTTRDDTDRKVTSHPMIGDLAPVGLAGTVRLADSKVTYSWSDGAPLPAVTATATAVYTRGVRNGFRFTVPAARSARLLRIHLGANSAEGELTAALSDASAPVWRGTFDVASGNGYGTAELRYAAASPDATLTITFQVRTSHSPDGNGNVTLHAATLDQ